MTHEQREQATLERLRQALARETSRMDNAGVARVLATWISELELHQAALESILRRSDDELC